MGHHVTEATNKIARLTARQTPAEWQPLHSTHTALITHHTTSLHTRHTTSPPPPHTSHYFTPHTHHTYCTTLLTHITPLHLTHTHRTTSLPPPHTTTSLHPTHTHTPHYSNLLHFLIKIITRILSFVAMETVGKDTGAARCDSTAARSCVRM